MTVQSGSVFSPGTIAIEVQGLWKRFGDKDVVQDVSLSVERGQVVGFVGPNGAGKTTTIRMLLDILKPDRGSVHILGNQLSAESQDRIGYLPEERGLYRGQKVTDVLAYLGMLKGMTKEGASARANDLLERLGMGEHAGKKISEMSRGLGQLIQFAATIIHRPSIIVLDEPFSGLDPINVRLMKDVITELRQDGVALLFSTHQMEQVEELSDKVMMINRGRVVLDDRLADIKRRYRGDALKMVVDFMPEELDGTGDVHRDGDVYEVRMLPGATPEHVLRQLLDKGVAVERFEVATPRMEDIFLMLVGSGHELGADHE
jgi:ABC-2 type transport system ATP-binding protein